MPGHHPVSAASSSPLVRTRHERERLVVEVCDRLSDGLDTAVATLRDLMKERDSRRDWGGSGRLPRRYDN